VSIEYQATILSLLDLQKDVVGFEERREAFGLTQEVLTRVAQYSQPIQEVQMGCQHPQQIINLQWQITDRQTKQFLPPQCDHTELEQRIQTLTNTQDQGRRRSAAPGTDAELQQELADMPQHAQQCGEEVRSLSMQLRNGFTLAA